MRMISKLPILYRRLFTISILIIIIYFGGTLGYVLLEDEYTFLDALYMTTITLATVGFHEVGQIEGTTRLFTIFLILIGITTLGYSISTITSLVVEGHIRHTFRDRKMDKKIEKLKDHIILCGHGRLGSHAAKELKLWNQPYVVIEHVQEVADDLREKGVFCLHGSAVEDDILIKAGVERARGLIAALAEDTDNLFVTLSARRINKDLEIIARANYENSEKKLISAGANKVLLPTQIAGRRMACMLVQPEVASFLDVVVETTSMDLSLQEISIEPDSIIDGVSIRETDMPYHIRIIGIKELDGEMVVNPSADHMLKAGQKVVVLGMNTEIEKYREGIN